MSVGKSIRRFFYLFLLCGIVPGVAGQDHALADFVQPAQTGAQPATPNLSFVRAFSSADDVRKALHPILDRTIDIIAGPKDDEPRVDTLQSPAAITTDSNGRVFVADRGAKAVHVFDFAHGKYGVLDRGQPVIPIALAVDNHDNLYATDEVSRTILVYDSGGKFRRTLGKLDGDESYYESPAGIAIDKTTGNLYACDMHRHMIIVLDKRGRLVAKAGKRGGGNLPGDFKLPTQAVIHDGELFVLDAGNTRIQIFDTTLHFRRVINLAYADGRSGLAVDDQGNIYVSDPVLDRIEVFARDGRRLYTFDLATVKAANLIQPAGLWISQGACLYVVDAQKHFVDLFRIGGQDAQTCQ